MESEISNLAQSDKLEYTNHKLVCSKTNTDSTTTNNYNNITTASTSEKNTKQSNDFGIDSVKSLRERLDKKLKAISETIDSISKKESMRGVSSSRDKERIEFGAGTDKKPNYNNNLSSVDYDNQIPKFNINCGNANINNNETRGNRFENKLENSKAQLFNNNNENSNFNFINKDLFSNNQENKENLDKNATGNKNNLDTLNFVPSFIAYNQNINLKEKDVSVINSRGNSGNKNMTNSKKDSNYNIPKNDNAFNSVNNLNFTHSTDNKVKPKEEIRQNYNIRENLGVVIKSNILINDNFDVNKIENSSNQEDLNNLNFLNNTSAAGIELNPNQYPKNFMLEENFISNDPYYKNLINNEISKISHDNFNDEEADPISDNDVEDFEIKRKKYNNIAVPGNPEEEREAQKNIFLNRKAEDKILADIEGLNSLQNSKSQRDKGTLDSNKLQDFKKNNEKDYLNNLNTKLNSITNNLNKRDSLEKNNYNFNINSNFNHINDYNNNQFSNLIPTSKEKKGAQLLNSGNNNRFNINNTKDDISMIHNVNLSLEKIEQSIRIHDENFLQKIEEVNKEKYQETLKNQEELEKIEANLSLMQRLTHEKWQIRKNAFKQISELIITLQANNKSQGEGENYDIAETMETLFPWLKYLITDSNIVALNEGLNSFCYLLDYCNNEQKNKALILFFDELEKLIMHNKNSISDLCLKIITNSASIKKFASFTISELIRKLNTTNNKLLMFLHRAIEEMLDGPGLISEHYLKLFFEKTVLYFNSAKQLNKNLERKKIYGKIITTIYERITDNSESLKHHLNLNSEDAANFDKLMLKANKDKKDNRLKNINSNNENINFTLYEPIAEGKIPHSVGNNANNYNTNKGKSSEINAIGSSNKNVASVPNNNFTLKDGVNEFRNYNSNNNLVNMNCNNAITEVFDLFNILPNEFFEIPYITALKTKKEILENVNRKLLDYVNIKDREYKEILNIINYTIDDTNVLVNLEGIKFLKNFCRLTKNTTNQTKLKNLVISCYEKFKDKKTNVKLELFDLFDTILLNHIFQFEQFFVFKLQHVISQKNPIVKQNILEYVKETFNKSDKAGKSMESNNMHNKDENPEAIGNYKSHLKTEESVSRSRAKSRDFRSNVTQENAIKSDSQLKDNAINSPNDDENINSIKEILNKNLKSKTIIALSKILVDIVKDDSQSQVKDSSVEILLILKSILQNESDHAALEKYENLISSLPNFRVNMIITGRTKSKTENTNTEREYKANLNKIKSNLQNYSRNKSQQKTPRLDTAQSVNKDNDNQQIKNKLNKNRNKNINESNYSNYVNTEKNEENEKSLKKNNIKKINSKYLVKNKLVGGKNSNTNLKNEDSKFIENNISENEDDDDDDNDNDEDLNIKASKNYKNSNQNVKSPNIKVISKKVIKENPETLDNKDKFANKKRLDFNDGVSADNFKKIKQKDMDEKVKKELRDKSQIKINLIKKPKQLNDDVIKKIKHGDLSKASATEDSITLNNSTDKFTLNKKNTKSKLNVNQNKTKIKPMKPNSNINQNNKSETSLGTDNAPSSSNSTDRSNLEKKMDSAIEYISNLNEEHIFDYTKSVIRDFLIFIKKVTSANNEKEDLDCHFKVIIKILDNIFDQMETLATRLDSEALNEFIPEEIFIQTFKIVITAPCFLIEIESVLIPFVQKLRRIINNDAKFFDIYYEILNKFICFEKGSSFLQGVNSKNTFIVFYDFFLFDQPKFEVLEILRKFEPYISKNIFFNEDEKIKYIKEYRQAIFDIEHRDMGNKDLEDLDNEKEENHILSNNDKRNFLHQNLNDKSLSKEQKGELAGNEDNNFTNDDNRSQNHGEEEEEDEEIFLQNYGNKFRFSKQNQIENYNEQKIEEEIKIDMHNNSDNFKSQTFKNVSIIKSEFENKRNEERSQTTEKALEINLPENLDKDISKIKESIKEKCRKLDMNIKRINNKIETEINPPNSNSANERILENNQNTTNINTANSQNDQQIYNKFNDYKNRMQQQNFNDIVNPCYDVNASNSNNNFKPKRNLEELEEIEAQEDYNLGNVNIKDELYDVHNLPKLNNFIQNKINNLPLSNRTHETHINNNQMQINNLNSIADYNERQGVIPNRLNNNLIINKNAINAINQSQNNNIDEIKKLILKIPSIILDDCVSEISHFVSLENSFMKMNNEMKNEFMTFLSSSINNDSLIKTSSFNCFLQLLEFLLTLLIYEMKNNQKTNADTITKNIILKLQETIENILKHKNFTEIFKVLIFLLRKYLPHDFNVQIDRENLIYLKTISYLLKINLENKIKQQASVNTIEILSEINELFLMYSPANLSPNVPNLEDLDKVYKLLRLLTDDAVTGLQNLPMAKLFLDNARKSDSNKYCSIYLQYLENVINL